MILWLTIFGLMYILILSYTSYLAKKEKNLEPEMFALGGGNLNVFLGVLTYSATLFSTFTLMGMPNFFRTHGVGAWIFLGVTDVAMAFLVILFGLRIHKVFKERGHYSMGTFLKESYKSKYASYIFLFGIFTFLVPYAAIQIKGISSFLEVSAPIKLSEFYWSVVMLAAILTYSSVGGFKAIVYSDAIQGLILLVVVWLISFSCIEAAGGIENIFRTVEQSNKELLSIPGPKGLLNFQFLLSAFLSIIIMPVTQPQLTTRLIAMSSEKKLKMMAPSVAFFVIAVILPATFLGMYGAIKYADVSAQEFWKGILITDQSNAIAALTIVGLIAAAMSTTDSQLFALGNEASILLQKDEKVRQKTKGLIFLFAVASLLFSIFSDTGLVQLARLSFAGTAILAPMILLAIFSPRNIELGFFMPIISFISLILFMLCSFIFKIQMIAGIRVELILYSILTISAICNYKIAVRKTKLEAIYDYV